MTRRRWGRPRRHNRLSSIEQRAAIGIAAASAVAAAFAGCAPAATPVADPLLTAAFAAAVTWAGATASWWALAIAAGGLALADTTGWRVVVSLAVCAFVLVIGGSRKSWAIGRAAGAAALVQVALRLDIDEPFGRSAIVAGGLLGLVLFTGLGRRSRRIRRRALLVAGIAGGLAVLGAIGAAAGLLGARSNITRGVDEAKAGLTALQAGDSAGAATHLRAAADLLGDARGAVRGPWMWPARLVPGLSQHVRAATSLVDAGRDAAATVSDAVVGIDLETVRVRGGRIDLDALAALAGPLRSSVDAVVRLDRAVTDSRSGWLVGPVGHRLGDLADETATASEQATNALTVADLAPALLGGDSPRVWFVMFTTPAEARGLGGFPGNFAELTVDDGAIAVTRIGRATDLINGGADPDGRTISGPADFLARYGAIGAGGDGIPMKRLFWNNVTLSPDLPTVAQVVAELYPQSGGRAIDGVIVADPFALAGIVELTGPLTVEGRAEPLTAANTADFLLREQYTVFPGQNQERKDALADVAAQATQALLSRDLPSPAAIARALGEPIRTGHLMVWSLHEADQEPLQRLGVSGAMPAPAPDGIAYTVNNSGPNKLDAYLTRSMSYDAVVDERTGQIFTTVTIRLRNDLPTPITLPPDVISNEKGLPAGTNRAWVSIYSPLRMSTSDVDGTPTGLAQWSELGWNVYTAYLNISPGQEVVLTARLGGVLDLADGYALTVRPQPLATENPVTIDVTDVHGERLVHHSGPLDVVTALAPSA